MLHQLSRHPHPGNVNIEHYHTISPIMSPSHSPKSTCSVSSSSRDGRSSGRSNNMYLPSESYPDDSTSSSSKRKLLIPDLISLQIQQNRQALQLQQYFYQQQRLVNSGSSNSMNMTGASSIPATSMSQSASILHSALQSQSSPTNSQSFQIPPASMTFQNSAMSTTNTSTYNNSLRTNEIQSSITRMSPSQLSRFLSLNPAFASMTLPLGLSFQ